MSGEMAEDAVASVLRLSESLRELKRVGVIRSRRITGDIGEWIISTLYGAKMSSSRTQKGWDLSLNGQRLQVKTCSYTSDEANQWSYLGSDPDCFDRMVVVILEEDEFRVRSLHEVPVSKLRGLLHEHTGKSRKQGPYFRWRDLEPFRLDPEEMVGYSDIAKLFKGRR